MFELIVVLCMITYDGEVCKTYAKRTPFETQAACVAEGDEARRRAAEVGIFVRLDKITCEKIIPKDGV